MPTTFPPTPEVKKELPTKIRAPFSIPGKKYLMLSLVIMALVFVLGGSAYIWLYRNDIRIPGARFSTGPTVQVDKYTSVEDSTPTITITVSVDSKKYYIEKNGVIMGQIPNDGKVKVKASLYKQTEKNAYIAVVYEKAAAQPLFERGPDKLLILNLETNALNDVTPRGADNLGDISSNETLAAWLLYGVKQRTLAIKNLVNWQEIIFGLPKVYNLFGAIRFSPDNNKVAFAAANQTAGKEGSAIYVIDIKSKSQTVVVETKDPKVIYKVTGWKDNENVEYSP